MCSESKKEVYPSSLVDDGHKWKNPDGIYKITGAN
jgi:hypothetical protein